MQTFLFICVLFISLFGFSQQVFDYQSDSIVVTTELSLINSKIMNCSKNIKHLFIQNIDTTITNKKIDSISVAIRNIKIKLREKSKDSNLFRNTISLYKSRINGLRENKIYVVDSIKHKINSYYFDLTKLLIEYSKIKYSFLNTLDSSIIKPIFSQDKRVKIISWNILLSDTFYVYYNIMQIKYLNGKIYSFFMNNTSEGVIDTSMVYDVQKWDSQLYFNVINKLIGNSYQITLFGWKPSTNRLTQQKIIETAVFKDDSLKFGVPIINVKGNMFKRLIFTYSAAPNMSIKYHENNDLIVFDHLSPVNSSYVGCYEYYGPDFSNDALSYKNGIWQFINDYDIRNIIVEPKDEIKQRFKY